MDKLTDTLTNEFMVPETVAVNRVFKAIPIKDSFSITLKFIDKSGQVINTSVTRFTNNQLSKSQHKLFIKTSYKEVENQFLYAKDEIIQYIVNELITRIQALNNDVEQLKTLTKIFLPSISVPQALQSTTTPTSDSLKSRM